MSTDDERIAYQADLRMIGRFLDQHHARQTRIIETPSGFSVQFAKEPNTLDFYEADFSHDDLKTLTRRNRLQPLLRRPLGAISGKRGKPTYQDFLRALGFELEEAGAYAMLLDELEDGFLLTYQYFAPDADFKLHKHRVALLRDEAGEIVNVAVHRRGRIHRKSKSK